MSFPRLKIWKKEKLKYRDLNAEFDNVRNNHTASALDGIGDQTSMESPVDNSGVAVTFTKVSDDIKNLRYQLAKLFGLGNYYSDPQRNLQAVPEDMQAFCNFSKSTKFECFLDTIRAGAILYGLRGGYVTGVQSGASDFDPAGGDASALNSANVKYGKFSFACGANRVLALPAKAVSSGAVSVVWKDLSNGDYLAYNPLLGIGLYRSANKIVASITRPDAASDYLKVVTTTAATKDISASQFYHSVLQFLATDGSGDYLKTFVDAVSDSSSSTNLNISQCLGGVWFFGVKPATIVWQKYLAMNLTPDAVTTAADRWKLVNNAGTDLAGADLTEAQAARSITDIDVATVATPAYLTLAPSGHLTSAPSAIGMPVLFKAPTGYVDLSNQTVECKLKLTSADQTGSGFTLCAIWDSSMSRFLSVRLRWDGYLQINSATGITSTSARRFVGIDPTQFNVIRITSVGATDPVVTIYVNGVPVYSFVNTDSVASGSDLAFFGNDGTNYANATAQMEYYAIKGDGAAVAPFAANSGGYIDEVAVIGGEQPDTVISSLGVNSAKKVFGRAPYPGAYVGREHIFKSITFNPSSTNVPDDAQVPVIADGTNGVQYSLGGTFTGDNSDVNLYTASDGLAVLSNNINIGNGTIKFTKVSEMRQSPGVHSMGPAVVSVLGSSCTLANVNFLQLKSRGE